MEMRKTLNNAFEDTRAFEEFKRKLNERTAPPQPVVIAKRPGETRQQYRARIRAEAKTK